MNKNCLTIYLVWMLGLLSIVTAQESKKGLTFKVTSLSNHILLSNCENCNEIQGDTICSKNLPLLCIKKDNLPLPEMLANKGDVASKIWLGGTVLATRPVKGDSFKTLDNVNELCRSTFGNEWQVVEIDNSKINQGFLSYNNTSLTVGERFWLHINDNTGTCWQANRYVWAEYPESYVHMGINGYGKDEKYVYFNEKIIPDADPKTFKLRVDHFIKSPTAIDQHAYYVGNIRYQLDNRTDLESFTLIDSLHSYHKYDGYARDAEHLFYNFELIENSDPDSFELIERLEGSIYLYADKNHFYLDGKMLPDIDRATFTTSVNNYDGITETMLKDGYRKDKNHIFYNFIVISEADPNNFELIETSKQSSNIYADENYFYREGKTLFDIDRTSFTTLIRVYDNNKEYTTRIEGRALYPNQKYFDYNGKVMYEYDSIAQNMIDNGYRKDKNHVFYNFEIIPDADPNSFELLEKFKKTENMYADKNYAYLKGKRLLDVDRTSYIKINEYYSKDNNLAFYNLIPIEDSDPNTFRIVQEQFAKDKRNIYYRGRKIPEGSADTIISIGSFGILKDKHQVYFSPEYSGCPSDKFYAISLSDKKFRKTVNKFDSNLSMVSASLVFPRLIIGIFSGKSKEELNESLGNTYFAKAGVKLDKAIQEKEQQNLNMPATDSSGIVIKNVDVTSFSIILTSGNTLMARDKNYFYYCAK